KNYGLEPILSNINFTINKGDRYGLVGINGTGKTTLIKIITGEEVADKGSVTFFPPNLRVGYLPQGLKIDQYDTISSFFSAGIGNLPSLEGQLAQLSNSLATHPDNVEQQAQFDLILSQINLITNIHHQAPEVLSSLGLGEFNLDSPIQHLSGGQKTRLMLARVLLMNPQLLLLDEPTNHLDITMIEWLEEWINQFQGGILLVSHDRTFLDQTVNGILELDEHAHSIQFYNGNYSDYLEQKIAKQDKQLHAYQDQQLEIARLRRASTEMRSKAKYRKGGKTDPSKTDGFSIGFFANRTKETIQKAKNIEKRVEKLEKEGLEKPMRTWQIRVDFQDIHTSGRDVLILEELSIGYAGLELVNVIDLILNLGERVAVIGENGSGKTTLVKTILREIPALGGNFRLGSQVKVGYMAQEQDQFDPNKNVLETINKVLSQNQTENRSFLSKFLFKGDDVFKTTSSLSFGERARLSLACLVAEGCNFLILDEPINHLDIPSRTQFEKALSAYEGTILVIAHDRYFIDGYATQIWEIKEKKLLVREKLR
ncbi:MAG TPA: ABC-F type ribosomal protection protein, partial [Anaerolineaceae bacterium]|nr:ABC-F type ribosomal protection protein [Anaerolineaceae bacterium]